jgi:hypothetical protein
MKYQNRIILFMCLTLLHNVLAYSSYISCLEFQSFNNICISPNKTILTFILSSYMFYTAFFLLFVLLLKDIYQKKINIIESVITTLIGIILFSIKQILI